MLKTSLYLRLRAHILRIFSWSFFLSGLGYRKLSKVLFLYPKSKAQLSQDLFVLSTTNFKEFGYFVEFGATNGIRHSNTYLLESSFSWNGILAEPGKNWFSDLQRNRKVAIDKRCVYSHSGDELKFSEANDGEYSTLDSFIASDHHVKKREKTSSYLVESVSLIDLLVSHEAPKQIDYVSIDTEGSEYEIIRNFDFTQYDIKVFTIEHNYGGNRILIKEIMEHAGYKRVNESMSLWDDWYVKQ
jgi:FkbM family methyltransferase